MTRPIIGITCDNRDNTAASGKYELPLTYPRAVAEAGGCPMLLPHEPGLVDDYINACDALLLTGGVDPKTEQFGCPTHPSARPIDPRRQQFELALIERASAMPELPVLGVCLGMQLMALSAGGSLDQYMPETLGDELAKIHQADNRHDVQIEAGSMLAKLTNIDLQADSPASQVTSYHRQAVANAGSLRVVARAGDNVVEAIENPERPFYIGVQWHPERGLNLPLERGLIRALVDHAKARQAQR